MKHSNSIYYLLIVLLVTGALAAMAQNTYGLAIMTMVGATFTLLFAIQAGLLLSHGKNPGVGDLVELISLTIFSLLLTLRLIFVRVPYYGVMTLIAIVAITAAFLWRGRNSMAQLHTESSPYWKIMVFYGGLLCFNGAFALSMFRMPASVLGLTGFALGVLFLLVSFRGKSLNLDGEKVSAVRFVSTTNSRALVVLVLFLLFTAYGALTRAGVIPQIHSNEYPPVYYDLLRRAESGQEKPVEGKCDHERFMEEYELFVKRNVSSH